MLSVLLKFYFSSIQSKIEIMVRQTWDNAPTKWYPSAVQGIGKGHNCWGEEGVEMEVAGNGKVTGVDYVFWARM